MVGYTIIGLLLTIHSAFSLMGKKEQEMELIELDTTPAVNTIYAAQVNMEKKNSDLQN